MPESALIQMTNMQKKRKPKTWKERIFSTESLCIFCLATTVFMANLAGDDGSNMRRDNQFRHSQNDTPRSTNNAQYQSSKYGAYCVF